MQKILLSIILLALPLISNFKGKVVRILDGDTIEVLTEEKKTVRVRLEGIDCPESGQPFSEKARQFTAELCFQKVVEVKERGEDKYNRTLAEIILPDGRSLNQELVKTGYAWHYKRYSKDSTLATLEQQARKAGEGLWRAKDPIAPWEWRRNK